MATKKTDVRKTPKETPRKRDTSPPKREKVKIHERRGVTKPPKKSK